MNNYDIIKQGLLRTAFRYDLKPNQPHFISDIIFGGRPIYGNEDTGLIPYSYRKYNPHLSTEVLFGNDPNRVNYKSGFQDGFLHSAYFYDQDQVDFRDATNRIFDEDLTQKKSLAARIVAIAADKRDELEAGQRLSIEKMAAEALVKGKVKVLDGEQTFPMTASFLTLAGANLFKKPIETLEAHTKAIAKASNSLTTILLMNSTDAINLIHACEKYLNKDSWNLAQATFGQYTQYGVVTDGFLQVPGVGRMEICHYIGAINGTELIPQGTAVLLPSDGKVGSMGYGRVLSSDNAQGLGMPVVQESRTNIYTQGEGDRKHIVLEQQCNVLPIITKIDGYGVITGIPTTLA